MVTTEDLHIPVPWGHISGKTWGNAEGRKVLVVHGWMDNCGTFDLLLPFLSEKLYLVCIDLPGHGQSSHLPPGSVYHCMEAVKLIRRLTKLDLKWDRFDYIGHSLGAAIGSVYAALFPETVDRMVMIDYAKMLSWEDSREITDFGSGCVEFMVIDRQRADPPPPTPFTLSQLINLYALFTKGAVNESQAKILLKRGARQLVPNEDQWTLSRDSAIRNGGLIRMSHEAMLSILSDLRCQLVVVKATDFGWDESDAISESALGIYEKNCASYQFIRVEGNHFLPLCNPTAVAQQINSFLTV